MPSQSMSEMVTYSGEEVIGEVAKVSGGVVKVSGEAVVGEVAKESLVGGVTDDKAT